MGAIIGDNGTGTSLNPGDALDGGTGNDVLSISISGAITTGAPKTVSAFTTNSIEKILVSNFDTQETAPSDDHIFNMSGAAGVTTVGLSSSATTGDTTFNNLKNVVDAEMKNGGGDLSVQYTSTLLTGTSDAVNLTVDGAGTSLASADFETYATATTGVAETLNIKSINTASYITLNANNDHKTINISGDANLSITTTLDTTVTKVDASTATGAVTLTPAAVDIAVTGGAGNDVVTIGNTLTTADTLDGGAGTDTLSINDPTTLVSNLKVSNFETLRLAGTNATAYDVSKTPGVTKVDFRSNGNAAISSSNVTEGAAVVISADNTNTITHGVYNATNSGVTNAVTVTVDNSTDEADIDVGTLVLPGIETVNLVSSGVTGTATTTVTLFGGDQNTSNSVATLTAAAATKLTISGSSDLVLAATGSTLTANTSVDASTMTGRLVYTNRAGAVAATTILGGTNDDFITGRTSTDSIVGGAGNDSLVGGGGNDTIDGGAGNDSITTNSSGTNIVSVLGGDGADTITAGSGKDNINAGTGDDRIVYSFSNLTDADTIAGGDGNDAIAFSDDGNIALTTASQSSFANVTGIEQYVFTGFTGSNDTVSLDDSVVGIANGNIALYSEANSGTTWDLRAVNSNSSKVNLSFKSTVTTAQTVQLGNGTESLTLTSASDEVIATNNAFLASADSIDGASGSLDTLIYTNTTGATLTSGLTNVKNMERIQISASNSAADYVLALTDTFLANNYDASGRVFAVTRNDANSDTGETLKVDGSAVSSSYNLWLDGATGNDTLSGGAGDDTLVATDGADSLTGGLGNDMYVVAAGGTTGEDTLAGVDLGTVGTSSVPSTTVDTLNLSYLGLGLSTVAAGDVVKESALTGSSTAKIIIVDTTAYATVDNVATALAADNNITATVAAFFWQDTLGVVHLTKTTNAATGSGTDTTAIAKLPGFTIADIAGKLTAEDLSVAGLNLLGSSQDDSITGGDGNDTLTGYAGNDTIVGGAGADVITGGAGADTIAVGSADSAADTVIYTAATEGGLSVITLTNVGTTADDFTATAGTTVDSVTQFVTTSDKISIRGALRTALNSSNDSSNGHDDQAILLADNGNIDADAGTVFIFHTDDDLVGDNFGDVSDIATTWNTTNSGTPANWNANEEVLFAVGNNSGNAYGVYYFKDVDGNGDIGAGDQLALVTIVGASALAAADFAFAA